PEDRYQTIDELKRDLVSVRSENKLPGTAGWTWLGLLKWAAVACAAGVLVWKIADVTDFLSPRSEEGSAIADKQPLPEPAAPMPKVSTLPAPPTVAPSHTTISPTGQPDHVVDPFVVSDLGQHKARRLERYFTLHPDRYSYEMRNEMRHLYGENELKMLEQCDIILQHDTEDPYTMGCVLDVGHPVDRSADATVKNLLRVRDRYPQYKYLGAACLIKAGEIRAQNKQTAQARKLFRQMLNIKDPQLAPYAALAKKYRDGKPT
ncbi:MAG: tetratricopeptide repeat protein, partial [Terriglobales bacterium]